MRALLCTAVPTNSLKNCSSANLRHPKMSPILDLTEYSNICVYVYVYSQLPYMKEYLFSL